ncbi:MAG: hypothetical protein PHP54_04400 [Clostridia bacterium]|nr:hypothetical protein [Clostridia bacterium]
MKYCDKKGITLLILMITITTLMIIFTAITLAYTNISNSTKQREFAKEIYEIQKLVDQYHFMNNKYPISKGTTPFLLDLYSVPVNSRVQFDKEPNYATFTIELREIDLYEIGAEEVNRGTKSGADSGDIYAVSESTGIVYYIKGQKIGRNKYFTLTDELLKTLDM